MTTVGFGGGPGGVDQPQIGGVWPVASAWVTEALARRDPMDGWSSLQRNTLFTHATLYPDLWYGIWTGPDSYFGPDAERPGEADAHLATALTDYPALNVHVHLGPIRALLGLLGVRPTAAGLEIAPRLPTESFAVTFPALSIRSAPDRIEIGYVAGADDTIALGLRVPSALRGTPVVAEQDGAGVPVTVDGERAEVRVVVRGGVRTTVTLAAAP